MTAGRGRFDEQTFEYLKLTDSSEEKSKRDTRCQWYDVSYEHLAGGVPESSSDLIRLMAMTYSWMPTTAIYSSGVSDGFSLAAQALVSFSKEKISIGNALDCLHRSTGIGIVPISKVMHFAFPSRVPMVDAHVARAWRHLFSVGRRAWSSEVTAKLTKSFPYFRGKYDGWGLARDAYIAYCNDMLKWQRQISTDRTPVDLRSIEKRLFLFSKYGLESASIRSNKK